MDTSSLIKTVTESLNQKDWNRHDLYYYKLDFLIPSINKTQIADIVLFKKSKPIGVIEVKRTITELKNSIQQAKGYASALGVNFIFITNGNEIFQVSNDSEAVIISEFPSVYEINQLLNC